MQLICYTIIITIIIIIIILLLLLVVVVVVLKCLRPRATAAEFAIY